MRHLLSIEDLDRPAIERILDRARTFTEVSEREIKKVPALRGRRVLNLFYEASTRTRSSFELAAKSLSADVINFASSGSSVEKGESLKDTVQTLSAYRPDLIVIRTPYVGAAALVAGWTTASVVNAGDGKHEHPTQALLDVYTLRERLGALDGLRIWIVGDVMHSRVARSNIQAFTKLGATVTVCGPPTLIPRGMEALGCEVEYTLDRLGEADVVYALRMQRERMTDSFVPSIREYAAQYQIDGRRLKPDQVLMHPGPVNRGVELAAEVIDSPQAVIGQQVAAGVVVRMAVLYELLDRPRGGRARSTTRGAARDARPPRPTPPADLLIRGAHVLDPRAGLDARLDVLVRGGEIAEIGRELDADAEVVDGEGKHLFAGFVDPHVHLRTPGQEHKEDLETGTRSAAAGRLRGRRGDAEHRRRRSTRRRSCARCARPARRDARIPVGFLASVTRGLAGEALTEMAELREAGALGFTDDGKPVHRAGILRKALQYQKLCGGVIALHEEDPTLSGKGVMHEGEVSARLGLAGIPSISESTLIARDASLAALRGRPHPHPAPQRRASRSRRSPRPRRAACGSAPRPARTT